MQRNDLASRKAPSGNGDVLFKAAVASAVFLFFLLSGYAVSASPPHDVFGSLLGRDFVSMWIGGHAAATGDTFYLYDFTRLQEVLHRLFGPLAMQSWGYPPPMLFLVWPFGALPYFPGLVLWSAAGLALYLAVARQEDRSYRNLLFLIVAPAVALNLVTGQNGFFTAVLIILALRHLDSRPVVAGIFLGLLTIKPQLGILFPVALMVSGRWRCFLSAAATALVLALASLLVFGAGVWRDFFELGMAMQANILTHGKGILVTMMPTAFMNARLLGAPPWLAWLAQMPFSVLAVGAVIWTFAKRRDPVLSIAVLVTAGFVVTPYVYGYDMVVFGWLIAMLRPRLTTTAGRSLALTVWALPLLTILLGLLHLPLSGPVLALFLLWLLRQLQADASVLPIEPRSCIASSSRAATPTSPARSHLRGS